MLDKYIYDSRIPGPKLLLLGAIHGNETAGTKAIRKLMSALDNNEINLKSGRLVLLPVCNPLAYEHGVRFVEKNLNRLINIYDAPSCPEEEFAHEVATEILNNDYVLDMHSTHNAGEPPFVFLDYPSDENRKFVSAAAASYVICNWPGIYKDAPIADYCTEYFAHKSGKSCITLECGYHYDQAAEEVAFASIVNLLIKLGMTAGEFTEQPKTYLKLEKVVIKEKTGKLLKNYKHLDEISAGEVIGRYDDGEEFAAPDNGYILIPNHEAAVQSEWFYLATAA